MNCVASTISTPRRQHAAPSASASALPREFIERRTQLVRAGQADPLMRLAALLLVLSRQNRHEGRDELLILDVDSTLVAELLHVKTDALARLLHRLQSDGLIHPIPGGLRIVEPDALHRLSREGDDRPRSEHRPTPRCYTRPVSKPKSIEHRARSHFGVAVLFVAACGALITAFLLDITRL